MDIITALNNAVITNQIIDTSDISGVKSAKKKVKPSTSTKKAKSDAELCIYANHNIDNNLLQLSIADIDLSDLSFDKATIDRLIEFATPAKFGQKEKTLLNTKIRNTLEIPSTLIDLKFDEVKWQKLLTDIHSELKLSPSTELTAHLHNLLIYEPGGLFKAHQDGEKLSGMLGSLILVLPAPHIGGDLHLHHNDSFTAFNTENIDKREIQAVAFYADQVHSVQPVKAGNRIALTFNLVANSKKLMPCPDQSFPELNDSLANYFQSQQHSDPEFLVISLTHHYSQVGLANQIFKGQDQAYIQQLLNSAAKNSLVINLVQLEYFESVDGYDEESVIDYHHEITFIYPFGQQTTSVNHLAPVSLYIPNDKLLSLSPLKKNIPDEFEKTGWMGNYGNTLEYWYNHTAVFIYPKKDQWYWAFKLSKENAIIALVNYLYKITDRDEAKQLVLDLIDKIVGNFSDIFISERIKIANYLADEDIAKKVLIDVHYFHLSSNHLDLIEESINLFSYEFIRDLLSVKDYSLTISNTQQYPDFISKMIGINFTLKSDILTALNEYVENMSLQKLIHKKSFLLIDTRQSTQSYDDKIYKIIRSNGVLEEFQKEFSPLISALLLGAHQTKLQLLIDKTLNFLKNNPLLYPANINIQLIKDTLSYDTTLLNNKAFVVFLSEQTQLLELELTSLTQTLGSYKVPIFLGCYCEVCEDINQFLNSPTQLNYRLTAVQKMRSHVEHEIRFRTKLCKMETIKKGSPHTLLIDKDPDLILKQQKKVIKMLQQLITFSTAKLSS